MHLHDTKIDCKEVEDTTQWSLISAVNHFSGNICFHRIPRDNNVLQINKICIITTFPTIFRSCCPEDSELRFQWKIVVDVKIWFMLFHPVNRYCLQKEYFVVEKSVTERYLNLFRQISYAIYIPQLQSPIEQVVVLTSSNDT